MEREAGEGCREALNDHPGEHWNYMSKPSSTPPDLTAALEPLYSAVLADVLDSQGYRHQALPAHIRPLTPTKKICGRVFPAKAIAVTEIPARPYELEIGAVDAMTRGDVLVHVRKKLRDLDALVMALNGHPTMRQMERFAQEVAARGGKGGRRFPWGGDDRISSDLANYTGRKS